MVLVVVVRVADATASRPQPRASHNQSLLRYSNRQQPWQRVSGGHTIIGTRDRDRNNDRHHAKEAALH